MTLASVHLFFFLNELLHRNDFSIVGKLTRWAKNRLMKDIIVDAPHSPKFGGKDIHLSTTFQYQRRGASVEREKLTGGSLI